MMTGPLLSGMRAGPEEPADPEAIADVPGPGELIRAGPPPDPADPGGSFSPCPLSAPQPSVLVKKKEVVTDGNA